MKNAKDKKTVKQQRRMIPVSWLNFSLLFFTVMN